MLAFQLETLSGRVQSLEGGTWQEGSESLGACCGRACLLLGLSLAVSFCFHLPKVHGLSHGASFYHNALLHHRPRRKGPKNCVVEWVQYLKL